MGSRTTSTTEIPEATEAEQEILNLITGQLLPSYLEEAGYEVKTKRVTFEDSEEYKQINSKLKKIQNQRNDLARRLDSLPQNDIVGRNSVQQQLSTLDTQINNVSNQMERQRGDFKPYTDYETRKKETPELEQLRSKYGVDSPQYREAKEQFETQQVAQSKQQERIYQEFRNRTEKFLKGDFSISDEQEALIQKNNEPLKKAIETMFKDNIAESGKTFDDFNKEAEKSGMSFSQAMGSVVDQIKTTGIEMERALKNVVSSRQELLKQGIDDYTGEITKRVAQNAAALGRDPSDPEYTADISEIVSKQVRGGELELANLEAQGLLGIRERTGGRLEQASQQKGAALADYESNLAKMRFDIGAGMPPQQLQVGASGLQYQEALAQQRLQNAAGTAQFPTFMTDRFARERFAQPTTTQSTPFGFQDALSLGLGVAGAGANIYGSYATSSALRGLYSDDTV